MSTPDIKSRPQRIELDYFRRPDPYTRLRWRLACLALFLTGCYALYATFWGPAAHVNTGPLSTAHSHLEHHCEKCHTHAWPVSLASDALRLAPERSLEHMESTCQPCHPVANHFRTSLNIEHQSIDRNCTGCHHEHLGRDHQLTWVSDKMCVTCHQDLPLSMLTASSFLRPIIQEFSLESHGEFRSLAKDPGRVRFNHSQHLRPGQVAPSTRGAFRLDMLPARWRGMYQKPGQAPEETVVLDCDDCHQLPSQTDAGLATADAEVTTAHFLPIRYSQHCEGCHALNYAGQTEDVLPLPHAAPWAELKTILAAKLVGSRWLAASDDARVETDATLGSRPGRANMESSEDDVRMTRALQFVRQQCLKCHTPDDITEQAIERLISDAGSELIPTRWFKHGSFDHAAHRQWDCQSCHHVTDSDPSSQPDNETVMIDGISSCTACHRAATSAPASPGLADAKRMEEQVSRAPDRCTLCHRYHWTRPSSASQAEPGGGMSVAATIPQSANRGKGHYVGVRCVWWKSTIASFGRIFLAASCLLPPSALRADEPARILGPASCASATCHGGIPGVGPAWLSSARVWESEDQHADAGMVLLNDKSRRMAGILEPRARDDDRAFFAPLRSRCVSCHATVTAAQPGLESMPEMLASGVSCEACHGPASNWIELHTRDTFTGKNRFSDAPDMRDNDAWLTRVAGCARCHVGSRSADGLIRDVNHDLIAAGHPALRFDPLWFAEQMPPHWDAKRQFDAAAVPHGRLQLFASGRQQLLVVAATLAGERLDDLSAEHGHAAPYPEFAEYNCLSCHRALTVQQPVSATSPGEPEWYPWMLAGEWSKPGLRETMRLQMEPTESNLARRQQLLVKLATTADEAAQRTYRDATRPPLRSLLDGATPISDANDAMIWYLELRAGWQDPEIRDTVPQDLIQAFEHKLSALGPRAMRLGVRGESLLNPVSDFDLDLFQQHRQGLLQLLEHAP